MVIWNGSDEPDGPRLGPLEWIIALIRLLLIACVIYSLMIFLLLVKLIEKLFKSRTVSPFIVQLACRLSMGIMCIPIFCHGTPMQHRGAVTGNHSSWLDIFALNAVQRVNFVSKAEVRKWPVIGMIAHSAGTVFIERKSNHAKMQQSQIEECLLEGTRLLFFPEGTSTDSRRVLPFKSTLFAPFFSPVLVENMWIQPVTTIYHPPHGEDIRFFGWWGDMSFGAHFLKMLGARRLGSVEIYFHDPVAVSDFKDRKLLAEHCEITVRTQLESVLGVAS